MTGTENAPGKANASSPVEEADPQQSRHRPGPKDKRLPDDLPVIEEVLDPEEVKEAPEQWRCIGQEVSEQLDYEPARFVRRRLIRRKYVSKQDRDSAPVLTPLPAMLQQRCGVTPSLLAHILVSKYAHHLPLYRQEQIYWRQHRVWLPRQNLVFWVELAADWLRPIYDAIRTGVMAGGYVQVDETPQRFLAPGHGKTKTGYFWTASRPGGDVFYRLGDQPRCRVFAHRVAGGLPWHRTVRRLQRLRQLRPQEGSVATGRLLGACAPEVF
ncbi:MAG: transposase [Verrucomicrobiota bacterium]